MYFRTDTDRTTVVTPRIRVGGDVAEAVRLDVSYTVDVWTSASVDIRSSASKPVTEQRDEINVSLSRELGDLRLRGSYRFSTEPDYTSHGGSLGFSSDFADRNTTLALTLSAFFDTVGRVGFAAFSKPARSYSARASFTQVLGPSTLTQGTYEVGRAEGFLSSPYRWVGVETLDGACPSPTPPEWCNPESNPEERMRHAFALRARQALSRTLSAGGGYRFYIDDWDVLSHTADVDLGWSPVASTLISARYRYYLQGAARHYRPRFPALREGVQFFTRDKELSPFSAHRVGLDAEHLFALDATGTRLRASLLLGWTAYLYSDFPPLRQINAYESTLALGLEL